METQTPNTAGVENGSGVTPLVQPPVLPSVSARPKSTPEQRANWRAKYARKVGKPLPQAGAPLPESESPADSAPQAAPALPVVPWCGSMLGGITGRIVDGYEQSKIDGYKAQAKEIEFELVAEVEQTAKWDPIAKQTLKETLPESLAKLLNTIGIDGSHSNEALLVGAVLAILHTHSRVEKKLEEMAAKFGKRQAASDGPGQKLA
jgi:hypothetical protein